MKVFKFFTKDTFSILDVWILAWAVVVYFNQNYTAAIVIAFFGGLLSGFATALVNIIERRK